MIILLGEVKQGVGDSGIIRDELMIEVGKAKEGVYILDFGRGWPGHNAIKLDWIHHKLTRFHNHPEIFDFEEVELAFLKLKMKIEFGHSLENTMGLLSMSCWIRGGDEEVVHVNDKPSFSNHTSEQVIHELLECDKGVTEIKEHDHQFEESLVGDEGYFPLVTIFDVDIVIPPANIKLSEVASILQLVHEVRDEGKG